jgi:hypothetical protein
MKAPHLKIANGPINRSPGGSDSAAATLSPLAGENYGPK